MKMEWQTGREEDQSRLSLRSLLKISIRGETITLLRWQLGTSRLTGINEWSRQSYPLRLLRRPNHHQQHHPRQLFHYLNHHHLNKTPTFLPGSLPPPWLTPITILTPLLSNFNFPFLLGSLAEDNSPPHPLPPPPTMVTAHDNHWVIPRSQRETGQGVVFSN